MLTVSHLNVAGRQVQALEDYEASYRASFDKSLERDEHTLDRDVLPYVIEAKNADPDDHFSSHYSKSTKDFIALVNTNVTRESGSASAIVKFDHSDHHAYVDVANLKANGLGYVVNILDPSKLAHEDEDGEAEAVAEAVLGSAQKIVKNILKNHQADVHCVIHVLGTQGTSMGCGVHSLGIGQIIADNPDIIEGIRARTALGNVPGGYARIDGSSLHESVNNLKERLILRLAKKKRKHPSKVYWSNSLYEMDQRIFAFATSLNKPERLQKYNQNLQEQSIKIKRINYGPLHSIQADPTNQRYIYIEGKYEPIRASGFIDHFVLSELAQALAWWRSNPDDSTQQAASYINTFQTAHDPVHPTLRGEPSQFPAYPTDSSLYDSNQSYTNPFQ
jgi:hypothetical protein